jgi:hypothetical protein
VKLTPLRRLLIAATLLGLYIVCVYWYWDRKLQKTYDEMKKGSATSIEFSPTSITK